MSTETTREVKVYGDLKRVIYGIAMGNKTAKSWLYPDCTRIQMFPKVHIVGRKLVVELNVYAYEDK